MYEKAMQSHLGLEQKFDRVPEILVKNAVKQTCSRLQLHLGIQ